MSTLTFTNQFMVTSIDLNTFDFPAPEVQSWSPLFGGGDRSATISAMAGHHRLTLWDEKGDVTWLRKEANRLLKDWMKDNRGNWLRVISETTEKVHAFNVEQAREYAAEKKKSAAALKRIAELKEEASA